VPIAQTLALVRLNVATLRHSRAGGNPIAETISILRGTWIPACAGMTDFVASGGIILHDLIVSV
jgi:hypothetical protein